MRARLALLVALAALAAVGACARAESDSARATRPSAASAASAARRTAASAREGITLEHASYTLVFEADGTTPIEGGFRIRTDAGATVDVLHATLTSYEIALVPCAPLAPAPRVAPSPRRAPTMGSLAPRAWRLGLRDLAGWFGPSVAHAGHQEIADASSAIAPRIESLAHASITPWAERTFPARTYCRAHYIVTRATTPEVHDFDRLATLHAEFVVDAGDGRPPWRRLGHVPFANGLQAELAEVRIDDPDVPLRAARVAVVRSLGTAFRTVDFTLQGRELERAILRGMMGATRIEVRVHPATGR